MSRLKGADLGIVVTNPTLAALGGAKNTIGAGLPSFIGRLPGDGHYDSAAKVFYILTGAASVSLLDTFNRTSLGTTLESGQTAISNANGAISNNRFVASVSSAVWGGDIGAGYSTAAVGGYVQADFFRGASGDTFELHLGSSDATGGSSGGWRFAITGTVMSLIDPTGSVNGFIQNPMNAGSHDVGTTHTWTLQVIGGVAKVYKDGALFGTSSTMTQGNGTKAAVWIASTGGGYADNFSAQSNGTLAWTPTTVANALNNRGTWTASPTPSYAVNDVVTRNGLAYTALAAPGSADPASVSVSTPGSIASTGYLGKGVGYRSFAQQFVPTANMNVDTVAIATAGTGAQWSGTVKVGIVAGAVSSGDMATQTFLASGSLPTSAWATGNALVNVPLNGLVSLVAGQTYTVVAVETSGSGDIGNLDMTFGTNTLTGLTAPQTIYFGTGTTITGQQSAGYYAFMSLRNVNGLWQPLAPAVENVNTVTSAGAVTLPDVPSATMHRVTLTANTTITLPTPGAGKSFTVELVQDATGGRTVTWATPSGAIRWPGGTAPTITATANAIDVVTFMSVGGINWYGFVAGQAFA